MNMQSDLLALLRHELRGSTSQISNQAAALCKVVWHQFHITWQAQADQQNEYRALKEKVNGLESRIAKLETGNHPE